MTREDDRLAAAVLAQLAAIRIFREQGFDPHEMLDELEKQVLTPGGEFYREDRGRNASHEKL